MIGRVDYCRVLVEEGRVEPLAVSGAAILSSTTRADGFVVVPADLEGYGEGAVVTVWLYDV
jgi:molybdopterin molybdotransferase